MRKIIFTTLGSLALLTKVVDSRAQDQEFTINAGGGLSGYNYPISNGASSIKPGLQAGIGYTRFLSNRWGISTGVELGIFRTKATLGSNTVFSSYEIDDEGNAFEFRVKAKGYEEKQDLYALNIPLMLQYQALPEQRSRFYAMAGLKLSIPINNTYETKADEIKAAGYYPDLNVEIDDLPNHGFGSQVNWSSKDKYDLNLSYALAAEVGWKFSVTKHNFLYVGAYLDYGLNNIKKEDGRKTLLAYSPVAVSQSRATGVFSLANTTGDARLMAYGVKFRFSFGSKSKAGKDVQPVVEMPAQAPVQVKEVRPVEEEIMPVQEETAKVEEENIVEDRLTPEENELLQTALPFQKIGDTVLSAAAKNHADKIVELMQRHGNIELQVEGHTCNLGSDAVNNRISMARAKAVTDYVQSKGIAASRLHTVAKGASDPLVTNNSEANRKQNRRVVFKVMDKE